MAAATKHQRMNAGALMSFLKPLLTLPRTRKKSVLFCYGFMFAFVVFTVYLAFNNSSFSTIFSVVTITSCNNSSTTTSTSSLIVKNYTIFDSSSPNITISKNTTIQTPKSNDESLVLRNDSLNKDLHDKAGVLEPNMSQSTEENSTLQNLTSSMWEKQRKELDSDREELVESLMNCDLFNGEWVRDDTYPLYEPGSCFAVDQQFNCFHNGRPDKDFQQYKWKPRGCILPRLNGSHMLELLRGKRLVFVGDSLNRNMWESLVCILRNSLKDQSQAYEASGLHNFLSEPSYSFVFQDYNCTVEFLVSHFLVEGAKNGKKKTLLLDKIQASSEKYKSADILIFNTGHWWTHPMTSGGKDYFQEGTKIYHQLNVIDAFRRALTTWGRWVDANVNPLKTLVFFRGFSSAHFSGGKWNIGGQCHNETEPIKNETFLSEYPTNMRVLEDVLRNMKTHVSYLNVTRLTDYRKDGHPSMYRKHHMSQAEKKITLQAQDCSHWCLPGVPDAWNEILYAQLLVKQFQKQHIVN